MAAALVVLLLGNPCAIYQILGPVYVVLYAMALMVLGAGYALSGKGSLRDPRLGLGAYALFFLSAVIFVLVAGIASGKMNVRLTVQFLFTVGQFFLIVYCVVRLGSDSLLEGIYRAAVVLAVLSLCLVVGNFLGRIPVPPVSVSLATRSVNLYFPFGLSNLGLPVTPALYRSYSFFTEPSYVAFFMIPLALHAYRQHRAGRGRRHLVAAAILCVAAVFSQSTAGLVVLAGSMGSAAVFSWLAGTGQARHAVLILVVAGVAMLGWRAIQQYGVSTQDVVLLRRYLTLIDRSNEWQISLQYVRNHPLGEGIGYVHTVQVARPEVGRIDEYSSFNNIFIYVYYLGWLFLAPLLAILAWAARAIARAAASTDPDLRWLALVLWYMLLYNGSVQVFFTALFQVMFSILLVKSTLASDRTSWREPGRDVYAPVASLPSPG